MHAASASDPFVPNYRVLADASNRSGEPRTGALAFEVPTKHSPTYPSLDAAIDATSDATRGAAVGASAIVEVDGGFVASPVTSLAERAPFAFEQSRSRKTFVTGRMNVYATDVRAIVDGARVETMPDYSAATPAAWQDLPLLRLGRDTQTPSLAFSVQRNQGARVDSSHFTNVGTDYEAAVKRATASVRRDAFDGALAILKGDDGSYYMTAFERNQGLFGEGTKYELQTLSPDLQALVGADSVLDLRADA